MSIHQCISHLVSVQQHKFSLNETFEIYTLGIEQQKKDCIIYYKKWYYTDQHVEVTHILPVYYNSKG